MRKLLVAGIALLLAGLALYRSGAWAHVGAHALVRYYGRRPSPAWIEFTGDRVGAPDVRELCRRLEDREEKDVMLLMNEVHGHIGPWSVVGCKMGLRALDLLDAPHHGVTVISEGGRVAPRGCITDGMMAAVGASLGHGRVELSSGGYQPAGTFIYQDKAVRLQVKPEARAAIQDTIRSILAETGGSRTAAFWQRFRRFGLQVWEQSDRREIFDETWVPAARITAPR